MRYQNWYHLTPKPIKSISINFISWWMVD